MSYAYVCLIFGSDSYLPGALTLNQSIIDSGSKYDRVCMYTDDIGESAIERLRNVFTKIVKVDYIEIKTIPLKTLKQENYYPWIGKSFTKWNCLQLTEYKKVLFCDCDFIFTTNCDELFNLSAPAATFSSPWAECYNKDRTNLRNPYMVAGKEPAHGDKINSKTILTSLNNSFVGYGSLVLLRPSENHFNLLKCWLIKSQPYGHMGVSGFDEQSIAEFYIKEMGRKWTNIHQRFNFCPRKTAWLEPNDKPRALHFINSNPWDHPRNKWPDIKVWWEIYDKVIIGDFDNL